MHDTTNKTPDNFDRLLEALPRIAEAFSSPKTQRAALHALVRSLGLPEPVATVQPVKEQRATTTKVEGQQGPLHALPDLQQPAEQTTDAEQSADSEPPTDAEPKVASGKPSRRKKRPGKRWETIRHMDWRPEGKQSFKDLIAEKQPTNTDQRNIVTVYWLQEIAEVAEITVGHVEAAFLEADWRMPSALDNALQITASQKRWLNTRNMAAIEMTPTGRNVVRHDMPIVKAKKSA